MTQLTHPELVKNLQKPGEDIMDTMSLKNYSILRKGIAETMIPCSQLEGIKKQVFYGKEGNYTAAIVRTAPALTPQTAEALHMGVGILGEASEVLQSLMLGLSTLNGVNKEELTEELGDLEFYLEGFRQALGLDREDILQHNINKLSKRYASGKYSDEQAKNREDKNPTPVEETVEEDNPTTDSEDTVES